jgi:hypothetical protein
LVSLALSKSAKKQVSQIGLIIESDLSPRFLMQMGNARGALGLKNKHWDLERK